MPRYIDADKLRKDILDLPNCYNGYSDTYDKACIIDMIDEQPTVGAEPVRHGSWYKTYDDEGEAWMCSECCEEWAFEEGHPKDVYGCNYCPNCGAKMDGERREDVSNIS